MMISWPVALVCTLYSSLRVLFFFKQKTAYEIDLEQLPDAAPRTGTALEINASPQRLDLNDVQAKTAKERGAQPGIRTDAHNRSQLKYMELGIGIARRASMQTTNGMDTRALVHP